MRTISCFLLLLSLSIYVSGQKIVEQYYLPRDSLRTGPGKKDFLPYNAKGYALILPNNHAISGVLVCLTDAKFNLQGDSSQQIHREAIAKNFAVVYISTGIPIDLYFSASSPTYVDKVLKNIFNTFKIPNKNIFFLGANLNGHRAFKYIDYCRQKKSIFNPDVKGIVLCDGVLDWVRQWYEEKKAIRDNFAESSVYEGRLVTYILEKNLGGTPKNKLEKYLQFSPYSYFDETHRHLAYYRDLAIRAYTEPATHYWLETKAKTTFDTNFPDMVGIINELKLSGNTKSELIVFNQDKNNKDRRNPNYTWGLVNKTELMEWIVAQTK